jgi:hypothetical protein
MAADVRESEMTDEPHLAPDISRTSFFARFELCGKCPIPIKKMSQAIGAVIITFPCQSTIFRAGLIGSTGAPSLRNSPRRWLPSMPFLTLVGDSHTGRKSISLVSGCAARDGSHRFCRAVRRCHVQAWTGGV